MPLICVILAIVAVGLGTECRTAWPKIQSTHVRSTFTVDGSTDFPVRLDVRDEQGTPRSRLECHSGDYSGEFVIYYSGTFHCALFAVRGDKIVSWNLLADSTRAEQSSDWNNRGRMLAGQLRGTCGNSPEYGRIRHFRVRGMSVTVEFEDLMWGKLQTSAVGGAPLERFTVWIRIRPDTTANSETAEKTAAPRPPHSCDW
jgi:hypothetical protein